MNCLRNASEMFLECLPCCPTWLYWSSLGKEHTTWALHSTASHQAALCHQVLPAYPWLCLNFFFFLKWGFFFFFFFFFSTYTHSFLRSQKHNGLIMESRVLLFPAVISQHVSSLISLDCVVEDKAVASHLPLSSVNGKITCESKNCFEINSCFITSKCLICRLILHNYMPGS